MKQGGISDDAGDRLVSPPYRFEMHVPGSVKHLFYSTPRTSPYIRGEDKGHSRLCMDNSSDATYHG